MKPVDKASWLLSLEGRVEQFVLEAVQHYQNLDEATLNRPSPTGGWSIAQCLAHLNSYGDYYLPRLRQGLAQQTGKPTPDTVVGSWLGTFLTKLMDPTTSRRKFRAVRQHQPPHELSAHRVVAAFINQQEALLQLLRAAKPVDINGGRIPLSIASWVRLPLCDILPFMIAHTERHLQQARRNR